MSDSLRHCSLDQLQLFSASAIRDITPLVVADKLRYAIPINWQNKQVLNFTTHDPPQRCSSRIGMARLEPSNEIVVTMNSMKYHKRRQNLQRSRTGHKESQRVTQGHNPALSTSVTVKFYPISIQKPTSLLNLKRSMVNRLHSGRRKHSQGIFITLESWSDSTNSTGRLQASKPTYCRKRSSRLTKLNA